MIHAPHAFVNQLEDPAMSPLSADEMVEVNAPESLCLTHGSGNVMRPDRCENGAGYYELSGD